MAGGLTVGTSAAAGAWRGLGQTPATSSRADLKRGKYARSAANLGKQALNQHAEEVYAVSGLKERCQKMSNRDLMAFVDSREYRKLKDSHTEIVKEVVRERKQVSSPARQRGAACSVHRSV